MSRSGYAPHVGAIERRALMRIARSRLAQFLASRDTDVSALAFLAEAALLDAIDAGVSLSQLEAELDLNRHTLTAILERNCGLLELHPSRSQA